jgi:hypothetical protein
VARTGARRRLEIDGGGATHTDGPEMEAGSQEILIDSHDGDGRMCFYFIFFYQYKNTGLFAVVVCRSEWALLLSTVRRNKVGHSCFSGCKRIPLVPMATSNGR